MPPTDPPARDPMTVALHHRIDATDARASVTPLYQNSAFEAGSPFFYTRKANPNVVELEDVVRGLEGTHHGVAFGTGMAAIRACLDLLRPGDVMVLNRLVYGCTFKLVQRFAERYGITLAVLDLATRAGREAMPKGTRLVLLETPTNPFLQTIDIAAVVDAARVRNPQAIVVVDNTWATSLFQRPVAHGADISLHSATKYLSGHSDVMGGIALTDRDDLAEELRATRFFSGAILDPHSAWLLRRSIQTLGIRLAHQARGTREIVAVLRELPQVVRVFYPEIDGHQLTDYAGIVFFQLRPDLVPAYPRLIERLTLFGSGTGMACVTSMIAQPYTGSHASMTDDEKAEIGLGRDVVRICVGLESVPDLAADLRQALASLDR